jgi:uncharacterized protein (DUF2336 family)
MLTNGAMKEAGQLLALAKSDNDDDRQRLMMGVADLCLAATSELDPAISKLMSDIVTRLAKQAEVRVRTVLARRLANAQWAPGDMILFLARDEITVAQPILLGSPVLNEDELIALLMQTSIEHRKTIAQRPDLGERVSDEIIKAAEPDVLEMLAWNQSARVSDTGMGKMVEASRNVTKIQQPLLAHPKLSSEMATRMYTFVADHLKDKIMTRFNVDEASLKRELQAAIVDASIDGGDDVVMIEDVEALDAADKALIDRLGHSGQLNFDFIMNGLKNGNLGLFEHGMARLGNFDIEQIRKAMRHKSALPLALIMRSLGAEPKAAMMALVTARQMMGAQVDPNVIRQDIVNAFQTRGREEARVQFLHDIGR